MQAPFYKERCRDPRVHIMLTRIFRSIQLYSSKYYFFTLHSNLCTVNKQLINTTIYLIKTKDKIMNIHAYFFKMPTSTALCIFNYGRKFRIDWLYM